MKHSDDIEPYTLRLAVTGEVTDPVGIIAALLVDVAKGCEEANGPLVGHIKCHAETASGNFHCSLTSSRMGAQCSTLPAAASLPVGRIDVDLAVLVHGLPREAIKILARAILDSLCRTEGLEWEVVSPSAGQTHRDASRG